MKTLTDIAETMIINRLMDSSAPLSHGSKKKIGLFVFAGICLSVTVVFSSLAGYHYLLTHLAEAQAAGVVALIAFFISCLVFLFLSYDKKRQERERALRQEEIHELIACVRDVAEENFEETVQNKPKTALAVAALMGFVSGRNLL